MVANWAQRRGSDRDIERRTRQLKEIVRLGNELRAEVELDRILTQVVDGITSTLGFRAAALNLIQPDQAVEVAATSGLTETERQILVQSPPPLARLLSVMRPEFCVSHSYFISHEYKHVLDGIEFVSVYAPQPHGSPKKADAWNPDDTLFIPLISPHEDRLLGIISLDQPEDGKVPSLETIEIIEMFASQAALAIETSYVLQEREHERKALEGQLFELLYQLEQVRQGDLSVHIQLSGETLTPMTNSLNVVFQALSGLLTDARRASEVVSASAGESRDAAARMTTSAQHQAQQIIAVSGAVGDMARSVQSIAGIANNATQVTQEGIRIAKEGREAAERAAEGMSAVREMALQSVKKMKRLGESSQEIGEIVQMVSDFASQTTLLALNAAIEAARAGENGRGFAVVAQEIRNLATSSAEATKHIQARIKNIQTETNSVVITIEHSTQQVVLQSELASQAGAALQAVDVVTERIANAVKEINETATQQAEAAATISKSMSAIATITSETHDSMVETQGAMDRLVELAHSLLRSIGAFKLGMAKSASQGLALLPPAAEFSTDVVTQPMASVRNPSGRGRDSRQTRQLPAAATVAKSGTTHSLPLSTAPLHPGTLPQNQQGIDAGTTGESDEVESSINELSAQAQPEDWH
jgi:methyl-accepting chemotaxis protein